MARPLRTITVAELMERLEGEDPEARVIFTADYGDRGRTAQALGISGEIEPVTLHETAYSNSGWAVDDSDDGDEEDGYEPYLLIR